MTNRTTDALVIGAGPVGLFQAFQLGLLGLSVEIVDALPYAGGQCTALYPDKPIYDIPGLVQCTGQELTEQLLLQCRPFLGAEGQAPLQPFEHMHLGQLVEQLTHAPEAELPFTVTGQQGMRWQSRVVCITAGVGAFVPRTWPIPACDVATLGNVSYALPEASSVHPWAGQRVVVVGGDDEALQTVVTLAQHEDTSAQAPRQITLIHRRAQFQATAALQAQLEALIAAQRVSLVVGVPLGASTWAPSHANKLHLQTLTLATPTGQQAHIEVDQLVVQLGLSPKLGPIADWGLPMARKLLAVDAATGQTAVPGIHAAGDICTYPGKQRLIVCGFHEATLVAHACLARVHPDRQGPLQYTTTSALLQQRLGVAQLKPA